MDNFKLSITLVSASYYMLFELEMESITIDTFTPEKYVRYIYTFYFLICFRNWLGENSGKTTSVDGRQEQFIKQI
jgi:hypothetical protein